ncbi:MAG: hypothetical protein ACXWF0_17895, partial [Usitatibacter sp.]
MPASRFSATVVTYLPDRGLLERAMASLGAAISNAKAAGLVSDAAVFVVDNSPAGALAEVESAVRAFPPRRAEWKSSMATATSGTGERTTS